MSAEDIMENRPSATSRDERARPMNDKRGRRSPLTAEEEWRYAEKALTWYGWGSPIGLSVFLLSLTGIAGVIRWMAAGF
jgi:hypothetical protein